MSGTVAAVLYKQFGAAVAKERRAKGLSQADLAAFLGLSRTSIANIEAGRQRVQLHLVYLAARALRAEVADLLPSQRNIDNAGAPFQSIQFVNVSRDQWLVKVAGSLIPGKGGTNSAAEIVTERGSYRAARAIQHSPRAGSRPKNRA